MTDPVLLDLMRAVDSLLAWREQLDLDGVRAKNCGVGSHGFTPGNSCGHGGGGGAGCERRRARAKHRKRSRGVGSGVGARTRSHRRKRKGHARLSRLAHEGNAKTGQFGRAEGAEHLALAKEHAKGRKELARDLKADRASLRKEHAKAKRETASDIKGERKEQRRDQARDRRDLKRTQEKETTRLETRHKKETERLDAKHAKQREQHGPDKVAERHQADKQELAARHADERAELADTHRGERRDLREGQQADRESLRADHRDRLSSTDEDALAERSGQHQAHRDEIAALRQQHRDEIAELHNEHRYRQRETEEESIGDVLRAKSAAAMTEGDVPGHGAILDAALDATEFREQYEAGTLETADAITLLKAVRAEGRRWLRAEAQALLDDLSPAAEKALIGGVRQAVGRFFSRAGKYVRELVAAGVLAIAGPDASVLRDPVVQTAIQERVAEQIKYLEAFEDRIVSEAKPLAPAFVANAEQYGSSVYGAAQEVNRQRVAAAATKKEERRVLGAAEHCEDCPPLADLGWKPIGTLPRIGMKSADEPTQCRGYCECHFEYR